MKVFLSLFLMTLPLLGCIKYKSAYQTAGKAGGAKLCSAEDEEAGNCSASDAEASAEEEGGGEEESAEMEEGGEGEGATEEGATEESGGEEAATELRLSGKNPATAAAPKAKWEALLVVNGKETRVPVRKIKKNGKLHVASKDLQLKPTDVISKVEVFRGTKLKFVSKPGAAITPGPKGSIQAVYCKAKAGSASDLQCK